MSSGFRLRPKRWRSSGTMPGPMRSSGSPGACSPRRATGERWARHWLDVVRFAETNGFETNTPRENAWPYRDYVIRAFNDDRPYTAFILEQLAGDAVGEDAATGFLVGGASDTVKS